MKSSNESKSPKIHFFLGCSFLWNKSCRQRLESGFTLLEMMIVVAIIAILSALAFPNISTLVPRYRTKAAARELRGYIQKAKLEAIKQNADCLVVFTKASGTDDGSCVGCMSSDDNCTGDEIIFKLDFNNYKSVALSNPNFSNTTKFVFNNRGLPKTTGGGMAAGSAVIENKAEASYSFKIVLASSGRIKIE